MKRPTQYSLDHGFTWLKEIISATVVHLWRPYRTNTYKLENGVEPVAVVKAGANDTLWSLAAKYYRGVDRPEQLWKLIAEVNDIVDPTRSIAGMEIKIPPLSLLEEVG